jgi:hypothetical protein
MALRQLVKSCFPDNDFLSLSPACKDDFMVTKVKIVITNAAGALIEEGDAGPDALKINLWGYKATAANPVLTGTKIRTVAYGRATGERMRLYGRF